MSTRALIPLIAGFLFLAGCGGGGGSSSGGSSGISYTGATSRAVIDESNREVIATESYRNGGTGDSIGGVLASLTDAGPRDPRPVSLTVGKRLAQQLQATAARERLAMAPGVAKATVSSSDTVTGTCGGSASYSISYDDQAGTFSGTFSYNDYCDATNTIDGTMSFSGNLTTQQGDNSVSVDFGIVTMSFDDLTITSGSDSLTADGTISADISGSITTVTSSMVMGNNTTGETFQTDDLTITAVAGNGYEDLSFSGRVYHPDYGYVTLSTPTGNEMRVVDGDDYPSSGTLIAAGDNNTSATITALSNTTYQIDIDSDGDGNPDSTDTGNWAEA